MGLLLQNINKIVGRESHLSAINLEFARNSFFTRLSDSRIG